MEVHRKPLTVDGLVRSAIDVAISVDLEVEAAPLCVSVEVHQAVSIPPAGTQQRRGVGKSEGSLQAAEQQEQGAAGNALGNGSPLHGGSASAPRLPLCLECESSDRIPSSLQRLIKGSNMTSHRKTFSTSLTFGKATF